MKKRVGSMEDLDKFPLYHGILSPHNHTLHIFHYLKAKHINKNYM